MYFPSFLIRSKSARRAPRAEDMASSANSLSQTISLPKDTLQVQNTIYQDPSTPPSSVGSEVSTPNTTPLTEAYLPLNLPQFPSLEDELPDSWKSEKTEKETFRQESDPLFINHRDSLIEKLLEDIATLRNKVRLLGDDNSRLRRELTRKRSQEHVLNGRRGSPSASEDGEYSITTSNIESVSYSDGQPGVSTNGLRMPLYTLTPQEGVKLESPNDPEPSEYSYYHNLEYFPAFPPIRRRNRAESSRSGGDPSIWGSLKRPRSHSLPTPAQLLKYSESRPKDNGRLELSPRLVRLIQQRFPPPPAAEQYTPEDVVLPFPWLPSEQSASIPILINPTAHKPMSQRFQRRPQSRMRLSALETVFRCFECSLRPGHCAYADGVWLMDRFVNFGYFEMLYYHANLGLWGPRPSHSSQSPYNAGFADTNGQIGMLDAEDDFRHYIGDVLDEVDAASYDGDPSPSTHLGKEHRRVETYLYSPGGVLSESQTRRERHIALLDSIMEEEELEEAPTSEPSEPPLPPSMTRHNSWSRPLYVSRLTQSTLPSIPEQEDSADSTVSTSPPLTEDGGSSSFQESQSRKSLVTFDDFEEIDFGPVLSSAGSDDGAGTSCFPPVSEVNTVPFPGNKLSAERMTWWEVTVSTT